MNLRPYMQFYRSIFPFVGLAGLISTITFGVLWGVVLFLSVGMLFGFFGFHVFYRQQYYFYFNLGITKLRLYMVSFLINLIIAIPLFGSFLVFTYFLFDTSTPT